jgi:hypothetical protein
MEDLEIVNITFKMNRSDIEEFEPWFKHYYEVIDFKHSKEVPRMYKEDETYKKMLKKKSNLTKAIEVYKNKNNHKYL